MYSIFVIVCNAGDGSNSLEWHKEMSDEKAQTLEDSDIEYYGSGDGIQITELKFRTKDALNDFISYNHISFYEEERD
jgi:hypothetical protein